MVLQMLVLGFSVGFIAVLPPGPVAISLIEVGVQQGRRGGVFGGLGVAGGDVLVASSAGVLVVAGGALPDSFFSFVQILSVAVLFGLGALLVLQPGVTQGLARTITRPGRTFFWLTALTPTVFGAWLAMIASMPFADDGRSVALFVAGAMVASLGYHLLLGAGAGGIGHRLSPIALETASRIGGLAMIGLGVWALG